MEHGGRMSAGVTRWAGRMPQPAVSSTHGPSLRIAVHTQPPDAAPPVMSAHAPGPLGPGPHLTSRIWLRLCSACSACSCLLSVAICSSISWNLACGMRGHRCRAMPVANSRCRAVLVATAGRRRCCQPGQCQQAGQQRQERSWQADVNKRALWRQRLSALCKQRQHPAKTAPGCCHSPACPPSCARGTAAAQSCWPPAAWPSCCGPCRRRRHPLPTPPRRRRGPTPQTG